MAPAFSEVRPGKLPLMQIGKVLGHRQNQDQLHPLRRLKVAAPGHLDPAPRAQVFLPENHD